MRARQASDDISFHRELDTYHEVPALTDFGSTSIYVSDRTGEKFYHDPRECSVCALDCGDLYFFAKFHDFTPTKEYKLKTSEIEPESDYEKLPLNQLRIGRVRVVGRAKAPGIPVAPHDVRLEVLGSNGVWVPIKGVTGFALEVTPNEPARVHQLSVEIEALNIALSADQIDFMLRAARGAVR